MRLAQSDFEAINEPWCHGARRRLGAILRSFAPDEVPDREVVLRWAETPYLRRLAEPRRGRPRQAVGDLAPGFVRSPPALLG
jgi:hypothetical protein